MTQDHNWQRHPIKNILLDINGVLYNSGEDHPIDGSVEAIKRLEEANFNLCLVTNECTTAKPLLVERLNRLGFTSIKPERIVSPAPVACRYLIEHNLRPRLHVWPEIEADFEPALERLRQDGGHSSPNCLVVGDAMGKINRDFMDESLGLMLNCPEKPLIISLGSGRYYKDAGQLRLDTGAYVAAFEFALGIKAINLGKPCEAFFKEALQLVDGNSSNTVMIGDDIVSDVGGAQKLGMRGFLVRTGKYKRQDETGQGVKADHVFDDLRHAVDNIIAAQDN